MFIYSLAIAALLYFIADRKIRLSLIPGITIILAVCYSFCWKMLYGGNKNERLIAAIKPLGIRHFVPFIISSVALTIVASTLFVFTFLFLGRLISKPIFKASGENGRNEKVSRILFLTASIITTAAGVFQLVAVLLFANVNAVNSESVIMLSRIMRRLGSSLLSICIYGLIFLAVGVTCIILALKSKSIYKDLSSALPQKKNPALTIGLILSAVGNAGVWVIAGVGLICWRKIFFFNGYGYTKVLCLICTLLMVAGLIIMLIGLANTKAKKSAIKIVFAVIMIIASVFDLLWLIVNAIEDLFSIYI